MAKRLRSDGTGRRAATHRATPLEIHLVARLRAAGCVDAEDEARLLAGSASGAALESLVARRVAGEPLEHVLGWAEFGGLRVAVGPGVFVPRRRTELLARLAVEAIVRRQDHRPGALSDDFAGGLPGPVLVDLCCGSGAVGAAVADRVPGAKVYAADLDPAAVACARRNLPADRVFCGDLYDALPVSLRGRVDLLAANAPYVPSAAIRTMPAEARIHEPRLALDGGDDGLDVQRRVVAGAADWLRAGGVLLLETGRDQAHRTVAACCDAGLDARVVTDDERDATAVVATAPVG